MASSLAALVDWALSNGCHLNKCGPGILPESGLRGIVATEAIAAGETVIMVPDSLNLSLESTRAPREAIGRILAPVVAAEGRPSGLQEELAVYMLLLAHCPAALPEGCVDMQPCVDALPARVTVPDLFSDEEIDSLEYPVTG